METDRQLNKQTDKQTITPRHKQTYKQNQHPRASPGAS